MTFALIALLVLQAETAQTEHYEVVSTVRDKEYVKHVAETLEAAYPALIATLGEKPAEKSRYRVNLYAKVQEYEDKDREMNGGRFASNLAFSHVDTGEAYLLVQPREAMRPMPDKMRVVLLHEAFHLIEYRHGVRQGRSAPWLEEGLAEVAAEESGGADALAASIKFSNAVHGIRALRKDAKLRTLDSLTEDSASQGSDWYWQSWLFVKYLKDQHPKQWTAFRARFRQSGEPGNEKERILLVKKLLLASLDEPLGDTEKDWLAWVDRLKAAPWWRVADGGDWRMTPDGVEGGAARDKATYLLSAENFKGERYRFSAEAQILDGGKGQVDLVLTPPVHDWDAGNMVKAVVTRDCHANILVRRKGEWRSVAHNAFVGKRITADRWVRLELEVNDRTVRFKVGGELAVEHTFTDTLDELHDVRWGFGNYDSWTRFRSISITKE